jgi:hypothetical protein
MIRKFQAGTQPSASHLNELVDAANTIASIVGSDFLTVNKGPGGISLGLNINILKQRLGWPSGPFIAKISGNTADGSNRWKYAWDEVRQSADGYGNWATFTGGLSGTTSSKAARSLQEDMNAATGVQGNGVDVADLVGTFALQPVPAGVLVLMTVRLCTDGTQAYWFNATNGITGACP